MLTRNGELDTLCFIQEQTSFVEDYKDFGYKVFDKGNRIYVIFDAVLQSFGVVNRNNREYDFDNVWHCIQTDDYIQSMLRQNSWMGEIDHPAAKIEGEKLTTQRLGFPDMTMTSHYIRNPRRNGNLLEATIQTDSGTEHGINFALKIVDGKIYPCFSARVFGALRNMNGRRVVWVRKLTGYDWVLYPSHPEAVGKIHQPMLESAAESLAKEANCTIVYLGELAKLAAYSSREMEFMCESFDITQDDIIGVTSTGNSVVVESGRNAFIQPLSDKRIRAKTRSMVRDWLNQ